MPKKGIQCLAFERNCEKMPTMEINMFLMRIAIIRQGARILLITLWNERIFVEKLLTRSNFDDVKTKNIGHKLIRFVFNRC